MQSAAPSIINKIYLANVCPGPQDQIHTMAMREVGVRLNDSTRGHSKWNGIKTCEKKRWVDRDA
jgi:hypothetical protein